MKALIYHVPRTGGNSLVRALAGTRITGSTIGANFNQHVAAHVTEFFGTWPAVAGHFGWGVHERIAVADRVLLCAIFRDPVERAFSMFRYEYDRVQRPGWSRGPDLESIAAFLDAKPWRCNTATRIMAGQGAHSEAHPDLGRALENLHRLDVVALTENLQRAVDRFAEFGMKVQPVGTHNASKSVVRTFNLGEIHMVRERNAMDVALYERARRVVS